MKKTIAVLAGDGIGPEVMDEALKVLSAVAERFKHEFVFHEALIGGAAYDKYQEHFPEVTAKVCEGADAILFGSVGGPVDRQMDPKWKGCETASILALRKRFSFNVNLRPVRLYEDLWHTCVLRDEVLKDGVDILCVRELNGGIYFGEHRISGEAGRRVAEDVMAYEEEAIEVVARAAFDAAMKRRRKVSSVDKANVLSCSKLWREVVDRVAKDYPQCEVEHVLVDNMAMQVLKRPGSFDVVLCPNMFGDIISDEISVFAGSLGMLPSASLSREGFGMYEPSGGSAPDIAGQEVANPIGQILSAAMMLKYSFGMDKEHDVVVEAVSRALKEGYCTKDIAKDHTFVSTNVMGDVIAKYITE